jgi:hypothetical protein
MKDRREAKCCNGIFGDSIGSLSSGFSIGSNSWANQHNDRILSERTEADHAVRSVPEIN